MCFSVNKILYYSPLLKSLDLAIELRNVLYILVDSSTAMLKADENDKS